MDIQDYLKEINTHTIKIYENEISQVKENNAISNWLVGLSGGGLLFSFNSYSKINDEDLTIIIIQGGVFLLIILFGLLHRMYTKSFCNYTTSIIRMFDFLHIELKHQPDEFTQETESEKLLTVYDKYINGDYFYDEDLATFDTLCIKQIKRYKITIVLSICILLLLLVEFGFFFVLVVT
ncbi:MAG: hypothetical protein JXJ22_14335 [Bacteroidales bacterium]|nr:hypothetical protein [Bacteroidales bacterium]